MNEMAVLGELPALRIPIIGLILPDAAKFEQWATLCFFADAKSAIDMAGKAAPDAIWRNEVTYPWLRLHGRWTPDTALYLYVAWRGRFRFRQQFTSPKIVTADLVRQVDEAWGELYHPGAYYPHVFAKPEYVPLWHVGRIWLEKRVRRGYIVDNESEPVWS